MMVRHGTQSMSPACWSLLWSEPRFRVFLRLFVQGRPPMTLHTGRHFLQIPGPSHVPDRVLRAMDQPTMDHRGPEFQVLGKEVLEGCKTVFKTKGPVIIYPSSGTGAWEAAIVNV